MRILCENCRTEFEVDNSLVGSRVECSRCGTKFTVPRPAAAADDAPQWIDGPHGSAFAGDWGIFALLMLLPLGAAVGGALVQSFGTSGDRRELQSAAPALACILGPVLVLGFWGMIRTALELKYTEYTLTRTRVKIRRGWLNLHEESIRIEDIRSVSLSQPLVERWAGAGDITLASSAGPALVLCGVRDCHSVVSALEKLRV